ncbi:O-antigen ligase family protein [Vibrio sp. SS-MA-C1-2]|uniref:O-antigen ligase family protein n=1 Tax=Vibrio sp. SS-MA-C1-2 TaxID=2908646 RepID=UPI001F1A866D|nr:O-antigen ligase family protein [Vibrio sp. SS-MA-C1-2]UJF18231.1 O-antigen ligase family protein [Vibrio sp. SS-MA-C1-2]
MFTYSYYQYYVLELGRSWGINPITYTTMSASIAITSLVILFLKNKKLMLVSFYLSFNSLLIGESRGVILAFFCAFLVILMMMSICKKITKKHIFYIFVIIAASMITNYSVINKRITESRVEAVKIENSNMNSSVGLRLQMWKTAIILMQEKPIVGFGDDNIHEKQLLADQGVITQQVVPFYHYHNLFLNAMVKGGVIELLLVLFTLFLPFYLFKNKKMVRTIIPLSISLVLFFASLTDVPLTHSPIINLYFMLLFLTEHKNCKLSTSFFHSH